MFWKLAVAMLLAIPAVAQEGLPTAEEPPTETEKRVEQVAAELKILNDRMDLLIKEVELVEKKVDDGFESMEKNFGLMREELKLTQNQARTSVLNWTFFAFIPATIFGGFIGALVAGRSEKKR